MLVHRNFKIRRSNDCYRIYSVAAALLCDVILGWHSIFHRVFFLLSRHWHRTARCDSNFKWTIFEVLFFFSVYLNLYLWRLRHTNWVSTLKYTDYLLDLRMTIRFFFHCDTFFQTVCCSGCCKYMMQISPIQ